VEYVFAYSDEMDMVTPPTNVNESLACSSSTEFLLLLCGCFASVEVKAEFGAMLSLDSGEGIAVEESEFTG
jgi:hypothetical protein